MTTWGGGRWDLPLLRGSNYALAYRAGQQWRSKSVDQRVIDLAMWTVGVDQLTGVPAVNQRLAATNNLLQLRSLFATQKSPLMSANAYAQGSVHGTLTRNWNQTLYGTTQLWSASANAEIAGNMSPVMSGRTKADFTVSLLLPDPYFYGPRQSITVPATGSTSFTNTGDAVIGFGQDDNFGGVSFTITLNGPLTAPTLTNVTAGVSFSTTAVIPAGHSLVLNVLAYTAVTDAGVNQLGTVTHSGARPWMVLIPGVNTFTLGSIGGGPGNVVISYQPGYL